MTASSSTPQPLRVFLSYSHDSPEHAARMLALADRLRGEGIDAILDQYEPWPPEGWPRWMERQLRDADFVLMICTATYYRRVMGEEQPGQGLGVQWESALIYNDLYMTAGRDPRFIPVLLAGGDPVHIPAPLRGKTYYRLDTEGGYEGLYRQLTHQPQAVKPVLGVLRALPPRERQQNLFDANTKRVIDALERPGFDWRTIDGVSQDSHLTPDEVRQIIKDLGEQVVKSKIPDSQGHPLYTTLSRYRQRQRR